MCSSRERIKILIADDNESDLLLLKSFVSKMGHDVVLAKDGQEAVAVFREESPKIVLLDALMPIKNGFEAAIEIKEIAGQTLVPIIFLTSLTDAGSLVKGLEAGGDDFLPKPYNYMILRAKMDAFNRMRINHNELQKTLEALETSKAQLVQKEKMASLGELVAGVAHEVNTPIGVGITAISHLGNELNQLNKYYQKEQLTRDMFNDFIVSASKGVEITQENLQRAAGLVKSFKQVAVDQSDNDRRTIFLKQHMNDVILSMRSQFGKSLHQININCLKDLQCVCEVGALTRVMTNILSNTLIHAYEGGKAGKIEIEILDQNEDIIINYKDDGQGMEPDMLDKIFDPFFTTKRGQGRCGLGAHIIYNQVNHNLGGQVKAYSKPGEGLSYKINFPKTGR